MGCRPLQNRTWMWWTLGAEEKFYVGAQGQVSRRSVGLSCSSVYQHWIFRMQVKIVNWFANMAWLPFNVNNILYALIVYVYSFSQECLWWISVM